MPGGILSTLGTVLGFVKDPLAKTAPATVASQVSNLIDAVVMRGMTPSPSTYAVAVQTFYTAGDWDSVIRLYDEAATAPFTNASVFRHALGGKLTGRAQDMVFL